MYPQTQDRDKQRYNIEQPVSSRTPLRKREMLGGNWGELHQQSNGRLREQERPIHMSMIGWHQQMVQTTWLIMVEIQEITQGDMEAGLEYIDRAARNNMFREIVPCSDNSV